MPTCNIHSECMQNVCSEPLKHILYGEMLLDALAKIKNKMLEIYYTKVQGKL